MQPQTRQLLVVLVVAIVAAVIGGYVALRLFGGVAASNKLAALSEVRRQELTEQDTENLKRIATAVEEYFVDHGGQYPRFLDDLPAQYLPQTVFIPGSNPAKPYIYVRYPANHALGAYVIEDDGSFDPSLYKLHNGVSGSLCTPYSCKYIVYAQAVGLMGLAGLGSVNEPSSETAPPVPGTSPLSDRLEKAVGLNAAGILYGAPLRLIYPDGKVFSYVRSSDSLSWVPAHAYRVPHELAARFFHDLPSGSKQKPIMGVFGCNRILTAGTTFIYWHGRRTVLRSDCGGPLAADAQAIF